MVQSTVVPITSAQLASENDTLLLEDESGRVVLTGEIPVGEFVTGVVIGVYGELVDGAKFHVDAWWTAGMAPQNPFPPVRKSLLLRIYKHSLTIILAENDQYVVLVSGLAFGANEQPLALQMMVEYLSGRLGDETIQEFSSKIVRVIVAGNLIASPDFTKDEPQVLCGGHRKLLTQTHLNRFRIRRKACCPTKRVSFKR